MTTFTINPEATASLQLIAGIDEVSLDAVIAEAISQYLTVRKAIEKVHAGDIAGAFQTIITEGQNP